MAYDEDFAHRVREQLGEQSGVTEKAMFGGLAFLLTGKDERMVDVTSRIEIARHRAEVAAYAAHPDNATTWYQNIKAVKWRTPRPLALGSQIAFVAAFLGRRLQYTYEVREHHQHKQSAPMPPPGVEPGSTA